MDASVKNKIHSAIQNSIATKQKILENDEILQLIDKITQQIVTAFRNQNKLFLCGNGGSAADAQHLAAELSGRFYFDRPPLFAEALHVNTSYLTAVANDYGYEQIYARYLQAAGKKGDVVIAISTSGNSPNILRALEKAQEIGMTTIGFSGEKECQMQRLCQYLLQVPSSDTPRIQEAHILIGHIICEMVEQILFGKTPA